MRLVEFDGSSLTTNPTLGEAKYICFTQAEMSYAVIAATIPTARKMMLNFITYYNAGGFGSTAGSGGRTVGESFPMGSMKPGSGQRKDRSKDSRPEPAARESQEMIIKKEVTVEISDDTALR